MPKKKEVLPTDAELGRHVGTRHKCEACGGPIARWFDIKQCLACLKAAMPKASVQRILHPQGDNWNTHNPK